MNNQMMMLHGAFRAMPGLRSLERVIEVNGNRFLWCLMDNGGYWVGWIRPFDNQVLFVCVKIATGDLYLSDLTTDMTGFCVAGYKKERIEEVSAELVEGFSLGGAV